MLPLASVRVLAIEQYGAAPIGTLYLASLGAEIIKIESPHKGGDVSRSVGPHFAADAARSAESLFFQSLNHNKKSLTLDLQQPDGQEILQRLVASVDAIASNLRGDVPDRLGITYPKLAPYNPRLVCAHLTAYGREGPRRAWPGYDYMMQAEAGYFALTGEPDGPPARFGLSVVDFMTGVAMALGLVAALFDARRSGVGRDIDVNLFDVALHNLNYVAAWFLNCGDEPQRAPRSAHLSLVPCQLYRARDGFIYIMCNKEKFWHALCDVTGHPEWKSDLRFKDYRARLEHRDALTNTLEAVLRTADCAEWLGRFAGRVPAAPVHGIAQALESQFVSDSERVMQVPISDRSSIRLLRPPIRCAEPQLPPTAAPALGEHTHSILEELGYERDQVEALRRQGVV